MSNPIEIVIQNFTLNEVEILVLDSISNKIINKYISKPRKINNIRESFDDIGSNIMLPKNTLENITLIFRMGDFDETYNFENNTHDKIIITLYLDNVKNNIETDGDCEILLYDNVSIGLKQIKQIKQSRIKNNKDMCLLICLIITAVIILVVLATFISYIIAFLAIN